MSAPAEPVFVRPLAAADREWATHFVRDVVGAERMAVNGRLFELLELPALVAVARGEPVALLTYEVRNEEFEVVSLHSSRVGVGAGTALIEAARREAGSLGCRRLVVVTTNDNTSALRFYQRRGFRISEVRPGEVDRSRRGLKPEIPEFGEDGIPIRDEIELEVRLNG